MYGEIDLLQFIKQKRLSDFMVSGALKPHHYSILKWFTQYTVRQSDSDDSENEIKKDFKTEGISLLEEPS